MSGMVVVAERMALVREGLMKLLQDGRSGDVVGVGTMEALDGPMGDAAVLLLDLALVEPLAAGVQALRARFPAVRIIALAAEETRTGILQCLAAGAHGYVAKTASAAELIRAVEVVGAGGVHVPAALVLSEGVLSEVVLSEGAPADVVVPVRAPLVVEQLTGRQRDVLLLMAEGRSTKDIARTLDLAVSTIKVHLAAVYRAVGARNRVEALCRAGLLPRGALTLRA